MEYTVRSTLLLGILAIIQFQVAVAQPYITNVDFSQGSTVTLYGYDFGDRASDRPVLYDTIVNQSAYQSHDLSYGDEIPVIEDGDCPDCPWAARIPASWGNAPKYYDQPDSVRVADRPMYKVSRKGFFRGPESFAPVGDDGVVYMSWWIWSSHSLRHPPGSVETCKIVRYTAGSGSDSWQDQIEITAHSLYGTGSGCSSTGWERWGTHTLSAPRWNHIELILEGGGNIEQGTGRAELRVNGQLQVEADQVYSCNGMLDHVYVWGADPSNPSQTYPSDSVILFGEMYLDTTQARVVLAASDSYDPSGSAEVHWEIQPTTSWQDGTVVIDFHPGTLYGDGLYLYVIDEYGRVSNPYPLNGEVGDLGPPGPPNGILIERTDT